MTNSILKYLFGKRTWNKFDGVALTMMGVLIGLDHFWSALLLVLVCSIFSALMESHYA